MDYNDFISKLALLFIGGVGGYLIFLLKERKTSDEKEKDRVKQHQLNVAQNVLQITNEAATGGYNKAPRDIEHIHSVLTNLKAINPEMENILNGFVSTWQINVVAYNQERLSLEEKKSMAIGKNLLDEYKDDLDTWANNIRLGKKIKPSKTF